MVRLSCSLKPGIHTNTGMAAIHAHHTLVQSTSSSFIRDSIEVRYRTTGKWGVVHTATPWWGLRQKASEVLPAGNLTISAAALRSEGCCTSMLRGVGRPAAAILARVLCLSRAASTASGALPDRPSVSATLDTRGTAISQKVHTPSSSPSSCTQPKQVTNLKLCWTS